MPVMPFVTDVANRIGIDVTRQYVRALCSKGVPERNHNGRVVSGFAHFSHPPQQAQLPGLIGQLGGVPMALIRVNAFAAKHAETGIKLQRPALADFQRTA